MLLKLSICSLQVTCDADGRITSLVAKWPGSAHDARILRLSALGRLGEAGMCASGTGNHYLSHDNGTDSDRRGQGYR